MVGTEYIGASLMPALELPIINSQFLRKTKKLVQEKIDIDKAGGGLDIYQINEDTCYKVNSQDRILVLLH